MSALTDSSALSLSYTDYSCIPVSATYDDVRHVLPDTGTESSSENLGRRRGPSQSSIFPTKLYDILSKTDLSHIITWIEHGRSWRMIDKTAFAEQIMKKYFSQTKYPSFIRQVNGWGFKRITRGKDQDSYYNELFLRTRKDLIKYMRRHSVAQKGGSASEPNLYAFPPLPPNPPTQIHDEQAEDSTTYTSEPMGTTDAHTGMRPEHHGLVHNYGHHCSSSSATPWTHHEPDLASSRIIMNPSYSQQPHHHPIQDQSYAQNGCQYNRGNDTHFSQSLPQQMTSSMNFGSAKRSATTAQLHHHTYIPINIEDGADQVYSSLSASELGLSSQLTFFQEPGTYSAEHRTCNGSNGDSSSVIDQQVELPETSGSTQQSNREYDKPIRAVQEFRSHDNAAEKKRQQGSLHLSPPSEVGKDDPPRESKKRKTSHGIQIVDSSVHPQSMPPSSRGFFPGRNQDSQAKATSTDTIIEPSSVNQYSNRPSSPLGNEWGDFLDVFRLFNDEES